MHAEDYFNMAADFFQTYFIDPIITQGVAGYNIYNTPVYALGFALAAFGAYKLLKKLQIKIDKNFLIGIIPFIVLGSLLRVVRDGGIINHWILVSPLIYFLIFALATAGLIIGVWLHKTAIKYKIKFHSFDYHITWATIGILLDVYALSLLSNLPVASAPALLLIAGITLAWIAAIFFTRFLAVTTAKIKYFYWLTRENASILSVHMFDATSTFVALAFFPNYYEQHVVSGFLIAILGPWGQFLLKLAVVPIVLYLLDKELAKPEERQLRNFLKIAIVIVGFAPGLRNTLRLGFGV